MKYSLDRWKHNISVNGLQEESYIVRSENQVTNRGLLDSIFENTKEVEDEMQSSRRG